MVILVLVIVLANILVMKLIMTFHHHTFCSSCVNSTQTKTVSWRIFFKCLTNHVWVQLRQLGIIHFLPTCLWEMSSNCIFLCKFSKNKKFLVYFSILQSKPIPLYIYRIGNRDIVGYGRNGTYSYVDSVMHPYPALR